MATATAKPATKSEILAGMADTTGLSRKQVSTVLDALSAHIKSALGKKGPGIFAAPGPSEDHRRPKGRRPRPQGIEPLHETGADVQGKTRPPPRQGQGTQESQRHGQVAVSPRHDFAAASKEPGSFGPGSCFRMGRFQVVADQRGEPHEAAGKDDERDIRASKLHKYAGQCTTETVGAVNAVYGRTKVS